MPKPNKKRRVYKNLTLTLSKDGDKFLMFDGSNLQESVAVGVGETKREAIWDYAHKNKSLIILLDGSAILHLFRLKSIFS